MNEKDLVNLFEANAKNDSRFIFIHKETVPNPPSPHMDIEFICDEQYFRAEAKHVDNDPRQTSQKALSLFGSILKGRNLPLANQELATGKEIRYSLVVHADNEAKFKNIYGKINESDWSRFGAAFLVTTVFVVSPNKIKTISWENFRS